MPTPMAGAVYDILSRKERRSEYVFPEEHARYIASNGSLSVDFTAILRSLGIASPKKHSGISGRAFSTKSFHSIRHTVVSMLRNSGSISADLCREIVWHDSEDIERLYYHASHYERQNAINYLEQTIAAQGAPAPLTKPMTGEP